MKEFIRHIILFVAILLVVSISLDIFISKQLRKSKSYAAGEYTVWNDIFANRITHDILIYGSSRAWVHFSPEIIQTTTGKSVYNMGLDGQSFEIQYLRHLKIFQRHIPHSIIFSLDIFSLERDIDIYNVEQFLPYMPDIDIWNYTRRNKGFTWFDYSLPLIRYAGRRTEIQKAVTLCNATDEELYRYNGYKPIQAQWTKKVEETLLNKKERRIIVDSTLRELFERCVAQCVANNVQVLFVYSPEHILGQKHIRNRDSVITIYSNIARKYNVPFYNFSNDSMCYSTRYFYNASHLNKEGSEIFSKKIATIVQKL